ncbi:hypothetical protein LFX15_18705 [Leptospira levettii]|uniref:hypothetical protein n=1 Tax=Leptospira levettii TaxID=2023178 RepID=UPI001EEA61B0|nr:hypothetical protein [Leptospira levettii]MCG6150335.1 hypothetical protein [Leptospira levettii]
MKNIITLIIISFLSFNCLSRTAIKLEEKPIKGLETNFANLSIVINNRKDSRISIEFYIQELESFEKNNNKFLPNFYFSESFKSDRINFSVPYGRYVGFLSIRSLDNAYFNRTISGFHQVHFGINKNFEKRNNITEGCYQLKNYSYEIDRIINSSECNNFKIDKNDINFEFSISDNDQINTMRTILLTWPSISYAAFHGPQQYPYAVFLIMQGVFGFTARDTLINFDNINNFAK